MKHYPNFLASAQRLDEALREKPNPRSSTICIPAGHGRIYRIPPPTRRDGSIFEWTDGVKQGLVRIYGNTVKILGEKSGLAVEISVEGVDLHHQIPYKDLVLNYSPSGGLQGIVATHTDKNGDVHETVWRATESTRGRIVPVTFKLWEDVSTDTLITPDDLSRLMAKKIHAILNPKSRGLTT